MAKAPALIGGFELPAGPRLPRIGSVDAVSLEERAATLAKRSIKRESKLQALDLAIRMMDLTTLEGQDTAGKVAALCSKAMRPDPADLAVPPVAAVCVYPNLVAAAKERLGSSGVKVASVATAFPSGQSPIEIKVAETRAVVELGADEVDMVIDRGAFLSGRYSRVYDEIVRVKDACGEAHLKVILETGELGTYDNVRRASLLAIAAGADFVKTSTGKISPAATLPVTLCMMEVVRDVHAETGHKVGIKPAGGIRTSKQAVQYLVTLYETLGPEWMTPDLFRFGASSLLNDVLMQIRKERTGRYQSPDYFTID
jgi:deoxyribose-phosphate aldolase